MESRIENVWVGLGVVIALFVVFYYVGYVSRRRTTSDADLYAAGFSIGPVTNGLAMAATWASLATFLGVIALIANEQVPFVYLWIQWALSIPLLTLLYGTSLRRIKSFTPASFIRLRYGNGPAIVIIGWMCLTMVMYALGQMIGLGQAFELLFGIPYETAPRRCGCCHRWGHHDGWDVRCIVQRGVSDDRHDDCDGRPSGSDHEGDGFSGWWFPPLAYGDMVPGMIEAVPSFFDMRYDIRWYFALIPAFTLGPIALPHLAMRVFTSASVKSARWAVVWFVLFLGLLFTGTFAAGFAGNFFTASTGNTIERPDQTILILNVFSNRRSWLPS